MWISVFNFIKACSLRYANIFTKNLFINKLNALMNFCRFILNCFIILNIILICFNRKFYFLTLVYILYRQASLLTQKIRLKRLLYFWTNKGCDARACGWIRYSRHIRCTIYIWLIWTITTWTKSSKSFLT